MCLSTHVESVVLRGVVPEAGGRSSWGRLPLRTGAGASIGGDTRCPSRAASAGELSRCRPCERVRTVLVRGKPRGTLLLPAGGAAPRVGVRGDESLVLRAEGRPVGRVVPDRLLRAPVQGLRAVLATPRVDGDEAPGGEDEPLGKGEGGVAFIGKGPPGEVDQDVPGVLQADALEVQVVCDFHGPERSGELDLRDLIGLARLRRD